MPQSSGKNGLASEEQQRHLLPLLPLLVSLTAPHSSASLCPSRTSAEVRNLGTTNDRNIWQTSSTLEKGGIYWYTDPKSLGSNGFRCSNVVIRSVILSSSGSGFCQMGFILRQALSLQWQRRPSIHPPSVGTAMEIQHTFSTDEAEPQERLSLAQASSQTRIEN